MKWTLVQYTQPKKKDKPSPSPRSLNDILTDTDPEIITTRNRNWKKKSPIRDRIRVITMSSGKPKQGDTRLVVAATTASALMEAKKADHGGSTSIVEYKPPVMLEDEEDLEVKLRRILENVPVRVSNTSGSSAGSGSGDFHQVIKT